MNSENPLFSLSRVRKTSVIGSNSSSWISLITSLTLLDLFFHKRFFWSTSLIALSPNTLCWKRCCQWDWTGGTIIEVDVSPHLNPLVPLLWFSPCVVIERTHRGNKQGHCCMVYAPRLMNFRLKNHNILEPIFTLLHITNLKFIKESPHIVMEGTEIEGTGLVVDRFSRMHWRLGWWRRCPSQ